MSLCDVLDMGQVNFAFLILVDLSQEAVKLSHDLRLDVFESGSLEFRTEHTTN